MSTCVTSVTAPAPRRPHSSSPSRAVTPPTVSTRGAGGRRVGAGGGSGVLAQSLPSDSGYVVRFPRPPVPSVSPPIRIESSSPAVVEGQTLDLHCVVAGQPQATISWYRRGGSLPARHQVRSGARPWGGQLRDSPQGKRPKALAGGTSSCLRQTEVGLSRSDADPQPLNPLRLCTPRPTAPT